jgi:hypothetical protein
MTDTPGRRRNMPSDPTDEPASDPVPTGEDVVDRDRADDAPGRHDRSRETPRRYEQPVERDPVLPSDDSTLNTQI